MVILDPNGMTFVVTLVRTFDFRLNLNHHTVYSLVCM